MNQNYEVFFGSRSAGKVQVIRQGLYYKFHCRCRLTGEVVCRLYAQCGDNRESLGVVVPMDGGFGLETSIPVKKLGEGEMEFRLIPKSEHPEGGKFVPIYPEEPFAYISRLKDAFLAYQDGQPGAVIPQDSSISSPTGQWSEPKTSE